MRGMGRLSGVGKIGDQQVGGGMYKQFLKQGAGSELFHQSS